MQWQYERTCKQRFHSGGDSFGGGCVLFHGSGVLFFIADGGLESAQDVVKSIGFSGSGCMRVGDVTSSYSAVSPIRQNRGRKKIPSYICNLFP